MSTEFYFPKTFPLFLAITSHYTWYRNQFPTLTYNQTNYSIEPILQKYTPTVIIYPDPAPQIIRDTIYLIRDTCSIDYTKINDLTFVLVLPEGPGGDVRLPDSTTIYQAMYGKIPPDEGWVDAIPRVDRFLRTVTKNGVTKTYQYTHFYNGTWVRRLKDTNGVWKIVDNGLPPVNQ
jgi:hypothetical protein